MKKHKEVSYYYSCDYCSETRESKASMKRHEKQHTCKHNFIEGEIKELGTGRNFFLGPYQPTSLYQYNRIDICKHCDKKETHYFDINKKEITEEQAFSDGFCCFK